MSENTPTDYSFGGKSEVSADADEASTSKRNAAVKIKKEKDCMLPGNLDGKLKPQSAKKERQRDMTQETFLASSAAGAKNEDADTFAFEMPMCSKFVSVPRPGPQIKTEGPTNRLNTPDESVRNEWDLPEVKKIQPQHVTSEQTPRQKTASYNKIKRWIEAKRAAGQMPPAPAALPTEMPSGSKTGFAPPHKYHSTAPESADDVDTNGHNEINNAGELKDGQTETVFCISVLEAKPPDSDMENLNTELVNQSMNFNDTTVKREKEDRRNSMAMPAKELKSVENLAQTMGIAKQENVSEVSSVVPPDGNAKIARGPTKRNEAKTLARPRKANYNLRQLAPKKYTE